MRFAISEHAPASSAHWVLRARLHPKRIIIANVIVAEAMVVPFARDGAYHSTEV